MFICFHCLVIITKVSLLYLRRGQETGDGHVALINTVEAAWCHCGRVRRCCYFIQLGIWVCILTAHVPLLHLQMFLSQSVENELKMETRMTIYPSALRFPRHLNLQHNFMSWKVHWTLACEFRICFGLCFVLWSYRTSKNSSATYCLKLLLHMKYTLYISL